MEEQPDGYGSIKGGGPGLLQVQQGRVEEAGSRIAERVDGRG